MAADGFTTIQRAMTVAEGEMFAELFRREGIEVHFHPIAGAAIGTGEQICDLRIDVPVESEARVRELLSELEYVGTTADEAQAAEAEQAEEPEAPAVPRRRPVLAAGIAFLVPGGGHFHARRPWTGLVVGSTLVCGWLGSFALLFSPPASFGAEMLLGAVVALVLADAIGGARAAMQENRGVHPRRSRQLARGFVLLACGAAAGATFATVAATPRWLLARKLARLEVRCTPRSLLITNGDREGRVLSLSDVVLSLRAPGSEVGTRYAVDHHGQRYLDVAPGRSGEFDFAPSEELTAECKAGTCDLSFAITAVHPRDTDVSVLQAVGSCMPYWDAPFASWAARIEPSAAAAE